MQAASVKRKLFLKALNKKIRRARENDEECSSADIIEVSDGTDESQIHQPQSISSSLFETDSISPSDSQQEISISGYEECDDGADFDYPYTVDSLQTDLDYDSESSSLNENFEKERKCENKRGNVHLCSIIRDKLRQWAISFCIVQRIITALLTILKDVLPCLPSHGKNLIRTKSKFVVTPFCPEDRKDKSECVYIGIANQLQRIVNPANHTEKNLLLQFNIDGLPLFKSGGVEFWPILGKVHFYHDLYEPFIISMHKGVGKPAIVSRYLNRFVEELNYLLENGITIENEFFTIEVMCFICDTPARAFIKNITGHTGFYAYERCTQAGIRIENRTIYPSVSDSKRTDESFRKQEQPEHHHGPSPLLKIKPAIDMVNHFALDFMHLCCLGVMKKLLEYWTTNIVDSRLTRTSIMRLTQRITNMSTQIPTEFQRQMLQSLGLISSWKATEFRFFLLYCGPLLIKDLLPKENYEYFLLFHVAMRILCCKKLCQKYLMQVENYLKRFVLLCGKLYKSESLIMNIHAVIHLVDDVKFFKCSLSEITAFPFENTVGKLKKLIHSGRKPLQQLCRRVSEQFSCEEDKVQIPPIFEIISKKKGQYKTEDKILSFKYRNSVYCTKKPDNCVLLKNRNFVLIERIQGLTQEEIRLFGKKFDILGDAFQYPIASSTLNIYSVSEGKIFYDFFLNDIECKAVFLSVYEFPDDKKDDYVIPMLH